MDKTKCEQLFTVVESLKEKAKQLAQSFRELREDGVVKLSEVKAFRSQVEELESKVDEMADEYLLVIKGKDENGKSVVMDFRKERAESEAFYRGHNLPTLAAALPRGMKLTREIRTRILEAMRQGMDRVLVCADIETQERIPLTKYKEELADKQVPNLPANDTNQYTPSYMEPGVEQATVTPKEKAARKGAYLLFYSTKPVSQDSKNLTYEKAEEWLAENKKNGLTLQELYAIQLKDFLAKGNHDLIAYNSSAEKSNFTWCIASRAPRGCVNVYWNAAYRRINVSWYISVRYYESLGVRPAVVVPL